MTTLERKSPKKIAIAKEFEQRRRQRLAGSLDLHQSGYRIKRTPIGFDILRDGVISVSEVFGERGN
jgi:hypothetical protein